MPREIRTVRPRWKFRTKTSETKSPSPGARLLDVDWKATQRGLLCIEPSSEGLDESPLPCASRDERLARTSEPNGRAGAERRTPARPRGRLHTNTSVRPFTSLPTRLEAAESNAT